MDQQTLSGILGVVWSLVFFYIPGLKTWYSTLNSEQKAVFMLGILFGTVAVILGLSCLQIVSYFTCDKVGIVLAVKCFFTAAVANVTTYVFVRKIGQPPA